MSDMRWPRRSVAAALLSTALLGCSTAPAPSPADLARADRPASQQLEFFNIEELERSTHQEVFASLQVLPDPLAPLNRFSLGLTKPVVDWVVLPVSKAYRATVPISVRSALERASYNLSFPSRFASLVLQGEARKSSEETARFVVNSTAGLAGFLDPASGLGLETYPDDVGLAFARWGVRPGFYLFLPFLGPSSSRDAVGKAFDLALNPLFWIPAPGISGVPFPNAASGASAVLGVNAFSFHIDAYESLTEEFPDLYGPTRALWAIQRQIQAERYRIPASAFESADPEPSLGVLLFAPKDPGFANRAVTRRVRIPATGLRLPYSVWMQAEPAPLLFLIPGVGAHRLGSMPVGIAEAAFARGYSVVSISSPLHPEFMVTGSSVAYPGFTPSDTADLHVALVRIERQLRGRYGARITEANLMGYSLGGLQTLFLAAAQAESTAPETDFARFVAINPPVDLLHAAEQFDAYFDAPLRWPIEQRPSRLREVAMKAFIMATQGFPEGVQPPFDRVESEFIVGFAGRATLAQTLATVERLGAPGLTGAVEEDDGRRGFLSDAVLRSSFRAYFEELALPYFSALSGEPDDAETMARSAGLRPHTAALRRQCDAYVITNADDFILGEPGRRWLEETLSDRATILPTGGHLGNIHINAVQDAIFAPLAGPRCR